MPNGYARAGSPRDDRGPVARLAPQTGDGKCPFAALLAFGSRLISRAESVREAGGKPAVVCAKTDNKRSRLQDVFYGSDGTRTRDLRRDRPVRGSRRLATMDAQSLYSCGFPGSRRTLSAWLSEAGFRRLLPVCCPRQRSSSDPPAHGGPRHQRFQLPLPSTNTMITRAGTAPPFSMRFGRSVV
jgi:hypothetical protein